MRLGLSVLHMITRDLFHGVQDFIAPAIRPYFLKKMAMLKLIASFKCVDINLTQPRCDFVEQILPKFKLGNEKLNGAFPIEAVPKSPPRKHFRTQVLIFPTIVP